MFFKLAVLRRYMYKIDKAIGVSFNIPILTRNRSIS